LVLVAGTGTDIGKTWVSARLLAILRAAGVTVAARKLAQSFEPSDDPAGLDAAVLGHATGESPETVCPTSRWYEVAMAPPMAADVLGRSTFSVQDLCAELTWPATAVSVGLVESAGGVRSPQADDGDVITLMELLEPDVVVLVADAGLGTINSVRLSVAALQTALPTGATLVVLLNRYDPVADLHVRNRQWLIERDQFTVLTGPDEINALASLIA
jgi:dethiobiotin synthetase